MVTVYFVILISIIYVILLLECLTCCFFVADCEGFDTFMRTCLRNITGEFDSCLPSTKEVEDSDGFAADEFYVVINKPVRYSVEDNVDIIIEQERTKAFNRLLEHTYRNNFTKIRGSNSLRLVQIYDSDIPRLKLCVSVNHDLCVKIAVHDKLLASGHVIWEKNPRYCPNVGALEKVLDAVEKFRICTGNDEPELQNLIPMRNVHETPTGQVFKGYRETYTKQTVRSVDCKLLVEKNSRCESCAVYRKTLLTLKRRKSAKPTVATPKKNWLSSKTANIKLTDSQKVQKIKQMRLESHKLTKENKKLRRKLNKLIAKNGIKLSDKDNADFLNVMNTSGKFISDIYSDENSYQRLFWMEQLKYNSLADKRGMRWHPMIVKWCIFLKSKSANTYDALRNSGFIHLPSERTLYDYTNYIEKGVGLQPDIISMLHGEMIKMDMSGHRKLVGLLHDEIKIQSDLVYDKHSGELIGFVNLGKINNDLLHIDECLRKEPKALAKYVLVLMVRGISTNLKFPLAHYATNGITSDQLFPILWEAVEILEIDLGLNVLFITSDGAAPNRRFVRLHRTNENEEKEVVYRAVNIFAEEERYIYFISDAPHLLKTTRNCFSNSHSHKKSRQLWNGKDISWLHIVDLFKDHCSGIYRRCPKLTRAHVDLTSYGCMKVSFAAQVMSSTVADAIELLYGPDRSETVQFINHINKFFDCMNVRSFRESFKKRNENVKPYQSEDDQRLDYLLNEFLLYFDDWKTNVENRPGNFSKSQRAKMQLSYQTLEGLKMTVKSVTECIRYCLKQGMEFVLTERFNQDPIEQHFGMHRTVNGCNTNPSLDKFNHTMVRLRTVGSQAIAPIRGNTRRQLDLAPIDATPLPKKQRRESV